MDHCDILLVFNLRQKNDDHHHHLVFTIASLLRTRLLAPRRLRHKDWESLCFYGSPEIQPQRYMGSSEHN